MICHADDIPDALYQELNHWYDALILNDDAYGWITQWATPKCVFIEFEGDQWTCVVELLHESILVGDKPLQVAGISGVMTHPEYQKRGLARQLIQDALNQARQQWRLSFALLTCKHALIPYYVALGWQLLDVLIQFTQNDSSTHFDPQKVVGMVYLLEDGVTFPDGEIDMQGYPW